MSETARKRRLRCWTNRTDEQSKEKAMGACFQTMRVPGDKTRDEVKEIFHKAQEADRYENGHSYSGGFGMASGLLFVNKTFNSFRDADDWLIDNCQKWEKAQCVTALDKDGKAHWRIGAWCAE